MNLAPEELLAHDSLICYYTDLEQLLDPKLLITYAYWIWKAKGQAFCEHVFGAWTSAMRSLPSSAWTSSLLHCCLTLLGTLEDADDFMRAADPDVFARKLAYRFENRFQDFHDKCWPGDSLVDFFHRTFASMTIEFVRQKLDARTIEEAFCRNEDEEKVKCLWKFVAGDRWYRRSNARPHPQSLRSGLGEELMMALINKGLSKWCWDGPFGPYNDNLLQYILVPLAAETTYWRYERGDTKEAKGRLCIFLAERFSLEELCREDEQGKTVFFYAEIFREHFQRSGDRAVPAGARIWNQVCHVIAQRMVLSVREFQGSLPKLIGLAQSVHYGLQGNLSSPHFFCFFLRFLRESRRKI